MKLRSVMLVTVLAGGSAVYAFAQSADAPAAAPAAPAATAHETPTPPGGTYHSAIPPENRRAFFGEMHLHTTMSFDAWTFGTKVTPDMAYKFGRGETIMVPAEQVARQQDIHDKGDVPAKRAWPLDFMAVTDHSESMGVLTQLDDTSNPLRQTDLAQKLLKEPGQAFYLVAGDIEGGGGTSTGASNLQALNPAAARQHAWDLEMKAANDNYIPGKFTTFIAYEWTSSPDGKNLHRNVFFNSDHAPLPFTSADSNKPEDLWSYLEKARADGIDVLAIPHNGDASGGLMYDWNMSNGRPMDEAYAQRRAMNEPLTEIVQIKGQSDTVPALSPNDEFANFEIYDRLIARPSIKSDPNGSYVRQALGRGLVIRSEVGTNPYKYGFVGGSDIHNGLTTSDENSTASNSFGLDPNTMMPSADRAKRALEIIPTIARLDTDAARNHTPPAKATPLEQGSAGLTGVWAEENTRNSIFAALRRKETFATSGTRMRLRMFGGWGFDAKTIKNANWVALAYAHGVAMGSDLPARPAKASAPAFILEALKDPDGANLDRIQIIKLWLEGGTYKEKIFDVALSGNRHVAANGHAPAVGNTVDLKTGKYTNSIGATMLTAVWRDPQFDPKKPAVYYARVLEIPTPRWSTLLAIKNNVPIPARLPATIQERGWTSPIWFTPG
ncbi:MAG: DUF3604 domain-containing protein [Proteobacteria bacterium]|nr:DUF3604 domain-containing protein [Pseudomonadota bacterium]